MIHGSFNRTSRAEENQELLIIKDPSVRLSFPCVQTIGCEKG
jgi:hypothetical protein